MPTISPQARVKIGNNQEVTAPARQVIHASTGMTAPKTSEQTGQNSIPVETVAPAVTLSPQLTALSRKQQKLQAEIEAFKAQREQFEKEKADYIPKSSFKTKMQQNAGEALKDLGSDYEEITRLLLEQQNGADPIKELKSELQQLKTSQEESVNKQYEATLKQYKAEVTSLVAQDPKAFHLINKKNQQEAVVQHIVDTWKENPDNVLTVAQAAKEIEEFLRDEAKQAALDLKELETPAEETQPAKKTLPPPQRQAPKTLTQSIETTPQRNFGQFQHLSPRDRIAQAIARASK
jgi:chromosome segregation ATPase